MASTALKLEREVPETRVQASACHLAETNESASRTAALSHQRAPASRQERICRGRESVGCHCDTPASATTQSVEERAVG